jgi:N-acyl homoserine lactone hydrolase
MIENGFMQMVGTARNFSAAIVAIAACLLASSARSATTLALTRVACGEDPVAQDVSTFSDTYAYSDFKFSLTYSCYLIRHGSDYTLWGHRKSARTRFPQVPS